ncbi:hypothetical protein O3P69_003512 [Scylla paramamosain]|uniref:Uncharacterized protein n=1 Tax=Scylla paramamosain TaxID=85552 RepID=A0AAW0UHD4_SCYPA
MKQSRVLRSNDIDPQHLCLFTVHSLVGAASPPSSHGQLPGLARATSPSPSSHGQPPLSPSSHGQPPGLDRATSPFPPPHSQTPTLSPPPSLVPTLQKSALTKVREQQQQQWQQQQWQHGSRGRQRRQKAVCLSSLSSSRTSSDSSRDLPKLEFVVEQQVLISKLGDLLEEVVEVEYLEKLPPPIPKASLHLDNWMSAVQATDH